jgi:uncharacterized membrane protein YfcA
VPGLFRVIVINIGGLNLGQGIFLLDSGIFRRPHERSRRRWQLPRLSRPGFHRSRRRVPANATNTVALWTGMTASGGAYRHRLRLPARLLAPLLIAGLFGGVAGALLLLKTSEHVFAQILPWLMLGATLLFVFGPYLAGGRQSNVGRELTTTAIVVISVFELIVAIYGGYFGGGVGIVNLAMLAALGMTDLHTMNALKSVLGSVINGIAVVVFVVSRVVRWPQAGVMAIGAILGGYLGAHYAQKLPQASVRWFVVLVGSA